MRTLTYFESRAISSVFSLTFSVMASSSILLCIQFISGEREVEMEIRLVDWSSSKCLNSNSSLPLLYSTSICVLFQWSPLSHQPTSLSLYFDSKVVCETSYIYLAKCLEQLLPRSDIRLEFLKLLFLFLNVCVQFCVGQTKAHTHTISLICLQINSKVTKTYCSSWLNFKSSFRFFCLAT